MIPTQYNHALQMLETIKDMRPRSDIFQPLLSRAKIACLFDNEFNLHALRCANNPQDDIPGWHCLEYLVVNPKTLSTSGWEKISREIYNPAFPQLLYRNGKLYASVVGAIDNPEQALKLNQHEAFVFQFQNRMFNLLGSGLDRVNANVRIEQANHEELYVLGTKWFPPPSSPSFISLRLNSFNTGIKTTLVDPVSGTDVPRSFPKDCAIHVSADGRIHVVYDGFFRNSGNGLPQLWHLILTSSGELENASKIGTAAQNPILTKIFTGADKNIQFLQVFITDREKGKFDHSLLSLGMKDVKNGQSELYFVDYWLQPHMVWFDGHFYHYHGPSGIRG
jgi:hypothetical protein